MRNNSFNEVADTLISLLNNVDFNVLPISEYNKNFVARLKISLRYYMKIYWTCIQYGLKELNNLAIENITLVDFGGGSGFLSMMAKLIGFKEVIYVDLNPNSVSMVNLLKNEILHLGPDFVIQGSSDSLNKWCIENNKKPQLLIATDLIEHVYKLEPMFDDLINLNKSIVMIYTTGSTPYNPYLKRKLHKVMDISEYGNGEDGYYYMRKNYIRNNFNNLSDSEIELFSRLTKGMTYTDILFAINNNDFRKLKDRHNTCDPETGNWTERILPISEYKNILLKYNYELSVLKGFYNPFRNGKLSSFIAKSVNYIIKKSGKVGLIFAPYIILLCRRK